MHDIFTMTRNEAEKKTGKLLSLSLKRTSAFMQTSDVLFHGKTGDQYECIWRNLGLWRKDSSGLSAMEDSASQPKTLLSKDSLT